MTFKLYSEFLFYFNSDNIKIFFISPFIIAAYLTSCIEPLKDSESGSLPAQAPSSKIPGEKSASMYNMAQNFGTMSNSTSNGGGGVLGLNTAYRRLHTRLAMSLSHVQACLFRITALLVLPRSAAAEAGVSEARFSEFIKRGEFDQLCPHCGLVQCSHTVAGLDIGLSVRPLPPRRRRLQQLRKRMRLRKRLGRASTVIGPEHQGVDGAAAHEENLREAACAWAYQGFSSRAQFTSSANMSPLGGRDDENEVDVEEEDDEEDECDGKDDVPSKDGEFDEVIKNLDAGEKDEPFEDFEVEDRCEEDFELRGIEEEIDEDTHLPVRQGSGWSCELSNYGPVGGGCTLGPRRSGGFLVQGDCSRRLLQKLAWAPLRLFTTIMMENTVACWQWMLASRPGLVTQVSDFSYLITSFGPCDKWHKGQLNI
ncbi:unnamed protein product [Protopolystoma xenopodis]|uniref:PI4-kinase N-terminal domain-containing protein n=1 Tax=Protopolystoma xenopodis TaxID=117903 RepID=A0A448WJL5_9PLAT|nr:unnamed protein product [Protopolystoma xenopodis]